MRNPVCDTPGVWGVCRVLVRESGYRGGWVCGVGWDRPMLIQLPETGTAQQAGTSGRVRVGLKELGGSPLRKIG